MVQGISTADWSDLLAVQKGTRSLHCRLFWPICSAERPKGSALQIAFFQSAVQKGPRNLHCRLLWPICTADWKKAICNCVLTGKVRGAGAQSAHLFFKRTLQTFWNSLSFHKICQISLFYHFQAKKNFFHVVDMPFWGQHEKFLKIPDMFLELLFTFFFNNWLL